MKESSCYTEYPLQIPFLAALHSLTTYAIGLYVFSLISQTATALYLTYVIWIELRLMGKSCRNCIYYGKLCGFGRGKICGILFKKGKTGPLGEKITWKDLLPDFLVFLMPLLGGVMLLAIEWSWILAGMLVAMILLSSAGNAIVRGHVCRHCKQRTLGCPAEQLFQKK